VLYYELSRCRIVTSLIFDHLSEGQGLVHIGAHYAEERSLYETKKLKVMWVEACPLFSKKLNTNLARYDTQDYRISALSRKSGLKVPFHISSNSEGVSSSFYYFGSDAASLWPDLGLSHVKSLTVLTKTFDQFVEEEQHWFAAVNPSALLIDVQGAELDVLEGAKGSLWRFNIIQIEASSVSVYTNGNTRDKVFEIMRSNGFRLESAHDMVEGHGDILFKRACFIGDADPGFSTKEYQDINSARIEHLASLNLELENQSVLELGCGPGDITRFLLEQGCFVTSIDGRPENISETMRRHQSSGRWNGFVYDLEQRIHPDSARYDIVLAYGVLYHLSSPADFIRRIAALQPKLFLLSTCVTPETTALPPNHPAGLLREDQGNGTQALHGTGCRPLRNWLWELLKKEFDNVYACRHQPKHPQFPTDWTINTNWKSTLTRMVFVCSHKQISSTWSMRDLPMQQTALRFSG
jgi:FkbM family methyltransferase